MRCVVQGLDYLQVNRVRTLFEGLTQELTRYKPNAPLDYIAARLADIKEGRPLDRPTVVFVLGGPGSGKGTQCALLAEKVGCVHLDPSHLVRNEVKSGSGLGLQLAKLVSQGQKAAPSPTLCQLLVALTL
eukprot:gene11965-2185_t